MELAPEDGKAHGHVADASIYLQELQKASEAGVKCETFGNLQFGLSVKSRVLATQGKLVDALHISKRIVKDYPDVYHGWGRLANILRELERFDDALDIYRTAIDKFPKESSLRCGKAATHTDAGELKKALSLYEDICREFSEEDVAFGGRAHVLLLMGKHVKAIDAFEEASLMFPQNSIITNGKANALRVDAQFSKALELYEHNIRHFPNDDRAWTGKAEVMREMGDLPGALDAYDAAINKFDYISVAYCGRANVFKLQDQFEKALQAYDQTIIKFPDSIYALNGRADLLKELGYWEEAIKAYNNKTLQLSVNQDHAQYAKAAIYVKTGDYDKARALLPADFSSTDNGLVAFHIQGMILLKTDEIEKAIQHFNRGLELIQSAKHRAYFKNALAIAELRKGKFKNAQKLIKGQDAFTDILRLHTFGGLNQIEKAKRIYTRLVTDYPTQYEALRDELASYYKIRNSVPTYPKSWIHEEECGGLALLVA